MGAEITSPDDGAFPPLRVSGRPLKGIKWYMTVPSAQVKSAILLAALSAHGESHVIENTPTRDHTERMLAYFGADIRTADNHIYLKPGSLEPKPIHVPGDVSSAAFFAVLVAATPGASLTIANVGLNPGRIAFLSVLQAMGAKVRQEVTTSWPEPVGTIHIEGGELKGIALGGDKIPGLIDELPILAVAAAVARGKTIVRGAQELRIKESDRIASIVMELCKMGVRAQELSDGFLIEGGRLQGAAVRSHGDHRIAMALAVAGCLCSRQETVIEDAHAASVSYPAFWSDLAALAGGDLPCSDS
jgi:3-phosphoshikimate 1-carboxyvinyltransferase